MSMNTIIGDRHINTNKGKAQVIQSDTGDTPITDVPGGSNSRLRTSVSGCQGLRGFGWCSRSSRPSNSLSIMFPDSRVVDELGK
jgi:hypothetical protein